MKHRSGFLVALGLLLAASAASSVQAQLYSAPPPLQGETSKHLWTVAGVINDGAGTVFSCSNGSSESAIVGIEIFGPGGGASLVDPSATSLVVAPGGTVMFGTRDFAGFTEDSNLAAPLVYKGSARILATDSKVICSAFIADPTTYPFSSATTLTIAKKAKQKGD